MKKIITLLFAVLFIAGASAFAKGNPQQSVRVLSVKKDIFYFKVSQSFIGGTVEVYGEDGAMIFSEKIYSHKAILDFYFQDAGQYEIIIKKDDSEVSFEYAKFTSKPVVEASTANLVSMLQQI